MPVVYRKDYDEIPDTVQAISRLIERASGTSAMSNDLQTIGS